MKVFLKSIIGLIFTFTLTACIGEQYDFTPPTVTIYTTMGSPDEVSFELEEANIDWNSDEHYKKITTDILSFAKEQEPVSLIPGQKVDYQFDSEDFAIKDLSVSIWKNNKEIKLEIINSQSFSFPTEKGEYILQFDLRSDKGSAQYVRSIIIQ